MAALVDAGESKGIGDRCGDIELSAKQSLFHDRHTFRQSLGGGGLCELWGWSNVGMNVYDKERY